MEQELPRRLVWLLGEGAQGARLESALAGLNQADFDSTGLDLARPAGADAGLICERFDKVEVLEEAMHDTQPDLVLVGAQIFGASDELEVFVETLRRSPAAGVPIVVVTDDGSVEMRRRLFKAGVNDFVLEPVVVSELLTRLRSQLMFDEEPSESAGLAAPLEFDNGARAPLSILVADAEPMIQRVLRSAFERRDWSVSMASDGREALQMSNDSDYDLVVFDLNLPFKNGFDLLGELGGASTSRRPRMVVLSAEKQHDSVLRAFELGADDFVGKPVNPDILVARIARLVRSGGSGVSGR